MRDTAQSFVLNNFVERYICGSFYAPKTPLEFSLDELPLLPELYHWRFRIKQTHGTIGLCAAINNNGRVATMSVLAYEKSATSSTLASSIQVAMPVQVGAFLFATVTCRVPAYRYWLNLVKVHLLRARVAVVRQ